MAHIRKQIRDAVVTALTGLASTGSNVFPMRVRPVDDSKYPALLVYTLAERSQPGDMGHPRDLDRNPLIAIEAITGGDTFDDDLDQIAVEVETAMANSAKLGGLVNDLFLESTDFTLAPSVNEKSDKRVAVMALRYSALVMTPENNPETTS